MKASVVIGANYGDEGKGLITDYLADRGPAAVIRFNGGAQAGHTVVTPTGERHVFKHFGSGTFAKAPTFLAKKFIVNPILFRQEWEELYTKASRWGLYADPKCPVTTPFDIMLNQAVEFERGGTRHGSCGVGINETMQRHQTAFSLTADELDNQHALKNKLQWMRHKYVPQRVEDLGLKTKLEFLDDDRIIDRFLSDCRFFEQHSKLWTWENFQSQLHADTHLIFEGAQGLLLDMDHGNHPHVTHSKTGIVWATELAKEVGIKAVDVFYVSRTYVTRHGNGPLSYELENPPKGALCTTNVHNEHQGPLRYAALDAVELLRRVWADTHSSRSTTATPHIVFTCADQTDGHLETPAGPVPVETFALNHIKVLGGKHALVSYGPTRNDIKEIHL